MTAIVDRDPLREPLIVLAPPAPVTTRTDESGYAPAIVYDLGEAAHRYWHETEPDEGVVLRPLPRLPARPVPPNRHERRAAAARARRGRR